MRANRVLPAGAVAACALLAPGVAAAAEKPGATTGGAANLAPTSAVVNGTVNPRGAATTYFFRYGTTRSYGAQTPTRSAGAGTAGRRVAESLAGLAPATTYRYEVVAFDAAQNYSERAGATVTTPAQKSGRGRAVGR